MTDMEKVISDVISAFDDWENNRCCPGDDWSDVHQSRDMVIALLKAQGPNEDWISRKQLKDEIQYYIDEAGWGDEVNKVLGWCMEFIDNQMAVKWE